MSARNRCMRAAEGRTDDDGVDSWEDDVGGEVAEEDGGDPGDGLVHVVLPFAVEDDEFATENEDGQDDGCRVRRQVEVKLIGWEQVEVELSGWEKRTQVVHRRSTKVHHRFQRLNAAWVLRRIEEDETDDDPDAAHPTVRETEQGKHERTHTIACTAKPTSWP